VDWVAPDVDPSGAARRLLDRLGEELFTADERLRSRLASLGFLRAP
jgi:hypothetical protein